MKRNEAGKAAQKELRSILTAIGKQKWPQQYETIVGLLGALYALGQSKYLTSLLILLHSEDSSVRHAGINSLAEIVRPDDKEQAVEAIRDMLRYEENLGLQIDGAKAAEKLREA